MVRADCHVHTDASDGTLTLPAVPAAARRAGVDVVAITDHDRLHPDIPAPVVEREGVTIVRGIELRVDAGDQRLDLLAFGVERTDALVAETERLQTDRMERGRKIIDNVETELGQELPIEIDPGIGRPHIAKAIAEATDHDVAWAFRELIGNDCPCYVARDVPSFAQGRELLADAAPIVGLAHPLRYPDPEAALEHCDALDAVERDYPYGETVDLAAVDAAIEAHDLLPTAGSDAHDDVLGVAALAGADGDRFLDAVGR